MKCAAPILLMALLLGCSTSPRLVYLPSAQDQTTPGGTPPAPAPVDVKALEARYPGVDGVFLERDTALENVTEESFITGPHWDFFETQSCRYVLFNPDSQHLSTFVVHAKKGYSLERADLQITYPDGRVKRFSKDQLTTETDSKGATTFKFIYPEVQKGCVISEGYVLKPDNCFSTPPIDHEVALQFSIPCQRVGFRYLYPSNWNAQLKLLGPGRSLPVTITEQPEARKKLMTYEAKDVPAVESESFAPFFKEVSDYAEIMVTSLSLHGVEPYRTPSDWDAFGNRFRGYVIDKNPVFSGRVRKTAEEVIASSKTDLEKLDATVTWLQENMQIEYLKGNFADNLAEKKGSIYQITGLANSMLKLNGIPAKYLLIHSAEDGYFDDSFFSNDELYIPALLVKLAGKDYFVFPYMKKMPITHVPERFQGQWALALAPAGDTELIKVPMGNQANNESLEQYSVAIQEDGQVRVQEERTLQGQNAYSMRRSLANLNKAETEKLLKTLLTYTEGQVSFNSYSFVDQEDYKQPLKIRLDYVIDNLVTLTPEEVLFHTGGLFSPASRLKTKVEAKDRKNPVRIYFDETLRKQITLSYPAAWELTSGLKDFKEENHFGTIAATYHVQAGKLEAEQTLTLRSGSEPKERFPELLSLIGKKSRLSLPTLVFKVKK